MVRTDFWQRGVPWVELVLRHGVGLVGAQPRLAAPLERARGRRLGARRRSEGRPRTAVGGLVVLAALNAELYELLLRRQGPAAAAAGVGLHAVHHVTGALAVPVGVARHLNGDARCRSAP